MDFQDIFIIATIFALVSTIIIVIVGKFCKKKIKAIKSHEVKPREAPKKIDDEKPIKEETSSKDNVEVVKRPLPDKIKWALILLVIQIFMNVMSAYSLTGDFAYSIGLSLGSHILVIISIYLVWRAYEEKK